MITKTEVNGYKAQIRALEKEIARLQKEEADLRKNWTKRYQNYRKASMALARITLENIDSAEISEYRQIVIGWDEETVRLTKARDVKRNEIAAKQAELQELKQQFVALRERLGAESKADDEIVERVFGLNELVVQAAQQKEEFLSAQVYGRLFDAEGNQRRQVSIVDASGLRKVVALVNSITTVRSDLAEQALGLINQFFNGFREQVEDPTVTALMELTKNILVEKKTFKVGPDLYRFLGIDIDEALFPELKQAQKLLRLSLRSEKTTSYIRLYERASIKDKWQPVPQS